jgi:hypothetical protein
VLLSEPVPERLRVLETVEVKLFTDMPVSRKRWLLPE